MENFVDAMDLTEAGEKNDNGFVFMVDIVPLATDHMSSPREREPWFETNLSYNPAIHRVKQAQFHAAVVTDLNKQPVPPPHPEILKYLEPPRRVLKRAKHAIDEAKTAFKVREGKQLVPQRLQPSTTVSRSAKEDYTVTQRRTCARERRR